MQIGQLRILIEYRNNFYIIIYKKIIINLQPRLFYFVSFNAYSSFYQILNKKNIFLETILESFYNHFIINVKQLSR